MNAMIDRTLDDAPRPGGSFAPAHRTHVFKRLLQREFWEHKGGFFWAPVVTGGVFLLLSLMGMVVGQVAMSRAEGNMQIDGREVSIRAFDFGKIVENMDAKDFVEFKQAINGALYMSTSWPLMVFGVVVFFYLLGALYDERKDRSVLFWKSLPLSDRDTVLSKVVTAVGVAPLLAIGAGLVSMLGFMLLGGLFVALHGGNPFTLVWSPGAPLQVAANLLASLPIYALWALPTVGWLLLCSAWAKGKPFLWAILVPVFAGVFVSWFDLMQLFDLESGWFWQHVVGRMLTSAWPGSHLPYLGEDFTMQARNAAHALDGFGVLAATYRMLLRPELWIGAVAGIAMIAAAIRLRRWRDEG